MAVPRLPCKAVRLEPQAVPWDRFDDLFWKVTKVLENFNRAVSEEIARKSWAHVTKMKDYVKRHFTGKVTAAGVAEAAGLSGSRALHLFRRENGMTLSAFIARQRISYAKYLLENTESSIAEVASECGFFDQSHFTKNFKRLERITPSHYRLKYKSEI